MKDFLGLEIFDSGIFLVNISFTWGFFAYSKQLEVVILMLLMKQKMCPGWCLAFVGHPRFFLSCFFLWGRGGGVDFVPIRSSRHLKSGVTPLENWVSKEELLNLK